jgi:hypothetical protein
VVCDTRILLSRRAVAVEDVKTGYNGLYSVSPGYPGYLALSDSEKAEVLVKCLETQFQPMTVPSVPAVIEVFVVVLFLVPCQRTQVNQP